MLVGIQTAIALLLVVVGEAEAKQVRSHAAKSEFKRLHPCPATQQRRGPCPGWQIDHITPLKCAGHDAAHNMQWLTVDDHKAKTRREAMMCRK